MNPKPKEESVKRLTELRNKLKEDAEWQFKCGKELEKFIEYWDTYGVEERTSNTTQVMDLFEDAYDCVEQDIFEAVRDIHLPNRSERIALNLWLRNKLHKMIWRRK